MKPPPRFVVDAMLGSLARKLRIFGFDTLYVKDTPDDALEALARREGRVLLTSDKALFRHSVGKGIQAFLVEGRTDRARFLYLQRRQGVGLSFGMERSRQSRCPACNGNLEQIGRAELAGAVPPRVLARHRLFYPCTSCSKVYWHGRHWERLRRLSRSLKTKSLTRTPRVGPTGRLNGH